jgi:hypothetical protein
MRPKFGAAYGLDASSMRKPFLAPSVSAGREELLVLVVTVWLGGGMLYLWIISLIFYRDTFFPLDLRPTGSTWGGGIGRPGQ